MNKVIGNKYDYAVFYDDGRLEVWECGDREGGVILSRNTWDILNQKANDRAFINSFKTWTKNFPEGTRLKLMEYFNNLDWVKNIDEPEDFIPTKISELYDIMTYDESFFLKVRATFAEYDKALANLINFANYRRNGKPPIKGSGFIRKRTLYQIKDGSIAEYAQLVFESRQNCIPERLSEAKMVISRIS